MPSKATALLFATAAAVSATSVRDAPTFVLHHASPVARPTGDLLAAVTDDGATGAEGSAFGSTSMAIPRAISLYAPDATDDLTANTDDEVKKYTSFVVVQAKQLPATTAEASALLKRFAAGCVVVMSACGCAPPKFAAFERAVMQGHWSAPIFTTSSDNATAVVEFLKTQPAAATGAMTMADELFVDSAVATVDPAVPKESPVLTGKAATAAAEKATPLVAAHADVSLATKAQKKAGTATAVPTAPVVLFSATVDTAGAFPTLPQSQSAAFSAAAVLEAARATAATSTKDEALATVEADTAFLLSTGGRQSYLGSQQWLKSQSARKTTGRLAFALAFEGLGANTTANRAFTSSADEKEKATMDLYLHVAKKNTAQMKQSIAALEAAAAKVGVNLVVVKRPINAQAATLRAEHEALAYGSSADAATLSSLARFPHSQLTRTSAMSSSPVPTEVASKILAFVRIATTALIAEPTKMDAAIAAVSADAEANAIVAAVPRATRIAASLSSVARPSYALPADTSADLKKWLSSAVEEAAASGKKDTKKKGKKSSSEGNSGAASVKVQTFPFPKHAAITGVLRSAEVYTPTVTVRPGKSFVFELGVTAAICTYLVAMVAAVFGVKNVGRIFKEAVSTKKAE